MLSLVVGRELLRRSFVVPNIMNAKIDLCEARWLSTRITARHTTLGLDIPRRADKISEIACGLFQVRKTLSCSPLPRVRGHDFKLTTWGHPPSRLDFRVSLVASAVMSVGLEHSRLPTVCYPDLVARAG